MLKKQFAVLRVCICPWKGQVEEIQSALSEVEFINKLLVLLHGILVKVRVTPDWGDFFLH